MHTTSRCTTTTLLLSALLLPTWGCGGEEELEPAPTADAGAGGDVGVAPDAQPTTIPVLGNGLHTLKAVEQKVVATRDDGLDGPTDVALHPIRKDELWITSQNDDAMVIIFDVGLPGRKAGKAKTPTGQHFLANPSGLAFNLDDGMLATIHEEDQITQATTPWDFMGPTLWSSGLTAFDGGHSSHLDMLHNTPNGMGIAWDRGNAYWVFDGQNGSLTRYDFQHPHVPGGTDHTDGVIRRYAEGQLKRVAGVPSHLELDRSANLVYAADSGNNRVVVLDPKIGVLGAALLPNFDGVSQLRVDKAKLTTLVEGKGAGLTRPSGLALHDGVLYVGDNATGQVRAFAATDGRALDWLDTGLETGALKGICFDPQGRLYIVDAKAERVLRLAPGSS
jgi:sugar lactone lactonase YvrE